jgi:hypothetical protein
VQRERFQWLRLVDRFQTFDRHITNLWYDLRHVRTKLLTTGAVVCGADRGWIVQVRLLLDARPWIFV